MSQVEHFNESQERRLLASASYIDKLLLEIEQILSASSLGGFPRYRNPLAPAQVRVVRDYAKRLRQQIVRVLTNLDIPLPEPRFDSTFSIKVTLQFIEVALEEIAAERLIGYGSVAQSLKEPLAGGIQEMKGIVRQISSYLSQRIDADLSNRLLQLRDTDHNTGLLKKLGEILERHHLVEFRSPLSQLIEKIESPTYEIAFFGRVSTGKSSLLNAIMGIDLLPVGVTPITAVPTRIKNGPSSELSVWTAEGRFTQYTIEHLAEFVTEARNPGNEKRIARLLVEIPLPLLPDEVLLVDTPGLGSLALEGAAETLAYLPHCDLGVVLVDATSNLQADDVGTVDALRLASVPALVVLSKADLIPERDRQTLLDYTRTQLARQLGMEIDVALLSSRPELVPLLQDWIANQIAPRVADAQRLSRESNQRKIRSIGRRVLHALEMAVKTQDVRSDALSDALTRAETQLRHAASLIACDLDRSFELTDAIRDARQQVLNRLTENALAFWERETSSPSLDDAWIIGNINQFVQGEAERLANFIQNLAKELTAALDTAASVLSTGEREDRFTLQNFVKDMPSSEFASTPFRFKKPRSLSLSAGWARRSIRREFEIQLGASLETFFTSYGRTLEVWSRGTLDSLAREFEIHADVYRAQLQRLTASDPAHDRILPERVVQDAFFLKEELDLEETVESSASG